MRKVGTALYRKYMAWQTRRKWIRECAKELRRHAHYDRKTAMYAAGTFWAATGGKETPLECALAEADAVRDSL